MGSETNEFTSAIYLQNGEYVGKRKWLISELSERWLSICSDLLSYYGPVFNHNMGSTLSHFDIRFVAGIAHYHCHNIPVLAALYLPGVVPAQDEGAFDVFKRQLMTNQAVAQSCAAPTEFTTHLSTHNERPLSLNLLWSIDGIDEADGEAIIDLSNHLAAAYLCRYTQNGAA